MLAACLLVALCLTSIKATNTTCTYPTNIPCPHPAYCVNSTSIVLLLITSYNCGTPLVVTGQGLVQVKGGVYKGGLTIIAPNVILGNADIGGNLTIRCRVYLM